MFNCKKPFFLAFSFLITLCSAAQTANTSAGNAENGFMRSEGKIYVVMAVAISILAGLISYLFRLDRRLSKLEKEKHF